MSAFVQTPGLHQRNLYSFYPYAGTPSPHAIGKMPFSSLVIMRERPTIEKLYRRHDYCCYSRRISFAWKAQITRKSCRVGEILQSPL